MSAVVAETDQHPPRSGQQRGTFLCEPEEPAQFIMGLGHQTGGIVQSTAGKPFPGVCGPRMDRLTGSASLGASSPAHAPVCRLPPNTQ